MNNSRFTGKKKLGARRMLCNTVLPVPSWRTETTLKKEKMIGTMLLTLVRLQRLDRLLQRYIRVGSISRFDSAQQSFQVTLNLQLTSSLLLLQEFAFWSNKDSIICLIDSSEAMFVPDADGQLPFHQVLRAVIQTFRNKILTSGSDLIGVCFYGTKEKDNPSDLPGILLFADLDVPDAERILRLEELLSKDFSSRFGHADKEVSLGAALWTCSTIFGNCTVKVGTKRVFLFTNNDSPNADQPELQAQAKQRAADLRQLGIHIELFPLNRGNLPFLASKFYVDVIDSGEEGDLELLDGTSKLQELLDRARAKEYKKRSQGKISFFITPGSEIGVRIYNLVQETRKGSTTLLDGRTSQPIRTITKRVCEDTGSLLLDSQVKHGYAFGGVRVMIEKHELKDIKTMDTASLRLVGFKPRSALKDYHNLKHASYIYPDEIAVRGSAVVYASLLQKMLEMEKIAICKFTARSNASLRLVALVPFRELVKDGIQVYPSGLYIIYLPYADDIRTDRAEPTPKATEDQIRAGTSLVRKLRIQDFDCRNFDNPVLQHHYMTLEAIALDRDEKDVEIPEDSVVPDADGMARLSNLLNNFKDAVFPDTYVPPDVKVTPGKKKTSYKKRGRDDDGELDSLDPLSSPTAKRKKLAEETDWGALARSGSLGKCTLDTLKGYCSANGIKGVSSLKKQALVDLVSDHITQNAVKSEDS